MQDNPTSWTPINTRSAYSRTKYSGIASVAHKANGGEDAARAAVYRYQSSLAGIASAPDVVRRHGLAEAHTFPLVSRGKVEGLVLACFRVPASEAWGFASLELRSGRAWPCVVLDCDGTTGYSRLMCAVCDREVPEPNWIVHRSSGGAHGVWTLERPVLRGAGAKALPLRLLARATEYLAKVVGADEGYTGVLSHNPMTPDPAQQLETDWRRKRAYPLGELGEVVPFGWKRPAVPKTGIGRNCAMFEALMKWAGSPVNLALPVLPAAWAVYRDIVGAFPGAGHAFAAAEVEGIARSVERYRARWIHQGRFYSAGERSAWGRRRGIRSGASRRKATEARDLAMVQDRIGGLSMRAIAGKYGLAVGAVHHVLSRDASLFV